jgi:hypothetical protein
VIQLLSAAARAVTSTVTARAVWLVDDLFVLRRCACGHTAEAHEHYRAGSECSTCSWSWPVGDPRLCTRYRYRPFTPRRP